MLFPETSSTTLRARLAELTSELYQLAHLVVDASLHVLHVSPDFPFELADTDLNESGIALSEAFGEFVGMEDLLHAILHGERSSFQIERVNKLQQDGSLRYLSFRVVPFDANEPSRGLLVIVEDVTRFGLIERSLVQSRNELRFVQDALARTNAELDKRVEKRTAELMDAKQQIEQQLYRLQALRINDLAILSTTDLRMALRTIVEQAHQQLLVDVVSIFRFYSHSLTLEGSVTVGTQSTELQNLRLRLGETLIGRAALERHILAFPSLSGTWHADSYLEAEALKACYVLPLIAKGNVVGVFFLGHRSPLHPDQDWLDFLELLAGQAAVAIDSISAFEDLKRSNYELAMAYNRTIQGWSHALDLRDRETQDHTTRVTEITLKLARIAGMNDAELMHIHRGALLHDIGKMGIPDAILLKEDHLTQQEWEIMRKHPTYAYEMLFPIEYLRPALDIPYCHHEKWDGTGYPRGLSGEQIPLAARLFALADVWDALRSDRPYRRGLPEAEVVDYIRSQSGAHFDPRAVELFLQLLEELEGNDPIL